MSYPDSPNTILYLCNVPWDPTYKHMLTFKTRQEQLNYFRSLSGKNKYTFPSDVRFRFIDGDGTDARKRDIKVPMHPEEAQSFNYAYYSNDGGATYHYMFITSVDYINFNTALLHLEEDIMQNYQFSYDFAECEVERMTVSSHIFGDLASLHNVPEPINAEMTFVNDARDIFSVNYMYYVCSTTYLGVQTSGTTTGEVVEKQLRSEMQGVSLPYGFLIFSNVSHMKLYLNCCTQAAKKSMYNMENILGIGCFSKTIVSEDCILSSVMSSIIEKIPQTIDSSGFATSTLDYTEKTFEYFGRDYWYDEKGKPIEHPGYTKPILLRPTTYLMMRPNDIKLWVKAEDDGPAWKYRPMMEKLTKYPYYGVSIEIPGKKLDLSFDNVYLWKNPQTGKLEAGHNITLKFFYSFDPATGFKCMISPIYYNSLQVGRNTEDYQRTINVPLGAAIPYSIDTYTQWLTANSITYGFDKFTNNYNQFFGMGNQVVSGATTGGVGGALGGAIKGTLDWAVSDARYQYEEWQRQAANKNIVIGEILDNLTCIANQIFPKISILQVDPRRVREIDEYFGRYGYACHRMLYPRPNYHDVWDYVKTVDCKIIPWTYDGNTESFMNEETRVKIQNIYNSGITAWHYDINRGVNDQLYWYNYAENYNGN